MKVTYQGPASVYSWPDKDGKVAGTLHPGESGDVPDEVLAGSIAQKGVRHQFTNSKGDVLKVSDLKKDAQDVARQQAAAAAAANQS